MKRKAFAIVGTDSAGKDIRVPLSQKAFEVLKRHYSVQLVDGNNIIDTRAHEKLDDHDVFLSHLDH